MFDFLLEEGGSLIGGSMRPDALFNPATGSLSTALRTAVALASTPFLQLGYVLLVIGLVQALIRQSDSPREQLNATARVVILALVISLVRHHEEWRNFVPEVSGAMASRMNSPAERASKSMGHFVELLYPGGDFNSTKGRGAYRTWFFNVTGRAVEMATNLVVGLIGILVLCLCFVAIFIGWLVGLVVVWLSETLYTFGLVLAPAAIGALGVDALRSVGSSYLLGLVSVGTGKLALALAHVGTNALLEWVVGLVHSLTKADVKLILTALPTAGLRQDFADGLAQLPPGGWGVLFLAVLLVAAWTIVTPVFAWKIFMNTLRTGAQFGTRLGFAFAGASLRALGNAAETGGAVLQQKAKGGGVGGSGGRAGGTRGGGGGKGGPAGGDGDEGGSASAPRRDVASQEGGAAAAGGSTTSEGPPLRGAPLAQARRRVGEAALRAHLANCPDEQIHGICAQVARASGAPTAQATELASEVCPAPAGAAREAAAAQPAAAAPAASSERPELARLGRRLTVAAAVLRRASAHASEQVPDPTDQGVLAAYQRTLPKPEKPA
ncbi:MAG: hypothetical protein JSR82_08045 [Verrucomicrobia bacterium]|nr:hypothetical protein [Verrucomicrobiota bacterium]